MKDLGLVETENTQPKDGSPERFRRIGDTLRAGYNLCQEQFAPDDRIKRLWTRLQRKSLDIGDQKFPGCYSQFSPKATYWAFGITISIELAIVISLMLMSFIRTGWNPLIILPPLTLLIDLALATIKHVFDDKLTKYKNSIKYIRLSNIDFLGKKHENEPGFNSPSKRRAQLNQHIFLIWLFKATVITALVIVAYFRVDQFLDHLGPAIKAILRLDTYVVRIMGYALVGLTTILHATLTGYFYWYYRFRKAVEAGLTDVWENKYESSSAIQWPHVMEIDIRGNRKSNFHQIKTNFHDRDVEGTYHGIKVIQEGDQERAFLITHGTLEDEHLRQLCNSVQTADAKSALACFLIKNCQLDRMGEKEVNNTNFKAFNQYPEELRLEILRRYRNYILFQTSAALQDNVLTGVKPISNQATLKEIFQNDLKSELILSLFSK